MKYRSGSIWAMDRRGASETQLVGHHYIYLAADVDAALTELRQAQAFVDRCHELGATDTDIVKHAMEDAEQIRDFADDLRTLTAAVEPTRRLETIAQYVVRIQDLLAAEARLSALRTHLDAFVTRLKIDMAPHGNDPAYQNGWDDAEVEIANKLATLLAEGAP